MTYHSLLVKTFYHTPSEVWKYHFFSDPLSLPSFKLNIIVVSITRYYNLFQSSLNFEKHSENFSWTENRYDVNRRRHNSSDGFDSGIGRPNGGTFC